MKILNGMKKITNKEKNMDTNTTQEKKTVNERIRKQIFKIEKENYHKKILNSSEMIVKIRKIIEEEVK